jgi:glycosyltransferase involved in cell wall biosynthesis
MTIGTSEASMAQRIWIASELYYPEETSTGYYLTRVAEGLADRFDVHVLCGQPTYSKRGIRAPVKEIRHGVSIQRCAGTTLDKNVIAYRLLNIITLSFSIFMRALVHLKANDEVMVVTTPPSLPFVIAIACWVRRANYILLIHDNYPEILIAAGKATPTSTLVRAMNWLNKRLYQHAERIVVVGRDMKELVTQKLSGDASRLVTIPNWAELETVDPSPRSTNLLLSELGLEEKFVLLYAGNMGYPNDIESIMSSASALLGDEKFHFLFIGSGVKKPWIESTVKEKGLRNVTVLNSRPRVDQTNFLNACDVAVISFVDKMLGVSMPSRTYNTLAAGKPIIGVADAKSELAQVIIEEEVGWVVPPHNPDLLVKAILDAASEPDRIAAMGMRARAAAVQKYSLDQAVRDYFEVFNAGNEKEK